MNNKILVWMYLAVLSIGTIANLYMPQVKASGSDEIVIPGEAIRLRILANSDKAEDQELKREVRDAVNLHIAELVGDLESLDEARDLLKSQLPEIEAVARKVLDEKGSEQSVDVKFGNVKFPTKLYGQFLYPAGEYEAILITLGEGKGANWWCVLFPPLCFLDFSSGTAVRSPGFEEGAEVSPAKEKDKSEEAAEMKDTSEDENQQVVAEDAFEQEDDAMAEGKDEPLVIADEEPSVEVRFFVVDMWKKLTD